MLVFDFIFYDCPIGVGDFWKLCKQLKFFESKKEERVKIDCKKEDVQKLFFISTRSYLS